jgi:threonine dehydrogenase-like Zn-dependent dehydrogenase
VIEATGSPAGFEDALAATRPRGTLVLKTTVTDQTRLDLTPLVVNEIRVIGSRCGPFPHALRALETGSIDVASLISGQVPLDRADEGLRLAAEPGALKVLIET